MRCEIFKYLLVCVYLLICIPVTGVQPAFAESGSSSDLDGVLDDPPEDVDES